eukprot:EC123278.1.p1 GENE.EC123278.1~~EC123278.1.p1  ORF type:complete len:175 (+),score=24.37 EC123278.1:62-586(+)
MNAGDWNNPAPATTMTVLEQYKAKLAERIRPWRDFFTGFGLPPSGETKARIQQNVAYFQGNYAALTLLVLGFSILTSPFVAISLLILAGMYFYLYIHRKEPLVIGDRTIEDREKNIIMIVASVVLLLGSGAPGVLLWCATVSALIIVSHGALHIPSCDDLFSQPVLANPAPAIV